MCNKVGAATTGIHQACDHSKVFKITKTGKGSIQDMQNRNEIPSNEFLKGNIHQAFQKFYKNIPAAKYTPKIIERYTNALIMISDVYQRKVNKEAIAEGFICSGQHCEPRSVGGSTVCFDTVMKQCYSSISNHQLKLMRENTPHFVDIIQTRGEITYDELTARQLVPGATTLPRNEYNRVRHWGEIVNHEELIKSFAEQKRRNSEEYKEIQRSQIIIEKENARQAKAAAVAEQKLNETPEEKQKRLAEARIKTTQNKEIKLARYQAAVARLAAERENNTPDNMNLQLENLTTV